MGYIIAAVLLALLAVYLLWQSARQRKATGLPAGRIVYADTGDWHPVEQPLYDARLGLTGKPDYLVEKDGQIVPVEVKTGRTPTAPHDTHIYQLAAYCLLVERALGVRPKYGLLRYPDRTFAVDFTPELEETTLDLLVEMRRQERRPELERSHEVPQRCARCGYRSVCDQKIG